MGELFVNRGAVNMYVRQILFAVMLWALAGCASQLGTGSVSPEEQKKLLLSVPDTTLPIQNLEVRISPMDILQITVFGASDLSNAYQVDYEGNLKLPLVGTLPAAGYSPLELADILEAQLGEKYLQQPDVVVRITETTTRYITIDGSVAKPGMYPVERQLTLLQAISLSGGPNDRANPKRVVVFRQIGGERNAAAFNLIDIRKGKSDDPLVYPNDVIVMDGSDARQTYGEVLRSLPLLGLFLAL